MFYLAGRRRLNGVLFCSSAGFFSCLFWVCEAHLLPANGRSSMKSAFVLLLDTST